MECLRGKTDADIMSSGEFSAGLQRVVAFSVVGSEQNSEQAHTVWLDSMHFQAHEAKGSQRPVADGFVVAESAAHHIESRRKRIRPRLSNRRLSLAARRLR